MGTKIFLAGASGVIGRSLIPQLVAAGYDVVGTTRTDKGKAKLEQLGIQAVKVNVFDREAITRAVHDARPIVVINQLTDLSAKPDAGAPEEATRRNARIRREGGSNLVHAARSAGVERMIVQSIGWAYAPKEPPYHESDPLDVTATGARAITVCEGVVPLESAVLDQPDFDGIVLRYGQLYGPGTWSEKPDGPAPLHVDAAAYAAFLAVERGAPGIYNIAEQGGALFVEHAIKELGWLPDFRLAETV